MILLDGIRYVLQAPVKEEVLEDMVKEHVKDIWGPDSYYFEKKKLYTTAGVGSNPDGYVVTFESSPRWYVVEVELSSHSLYDHILPQVSKFAAGVLNVSSRQQIVNAIWRAIDNNEALKIWAKTNIAPSEVHKYLSDVISKPPILAVIFEEMHQQWNEVRDQLGQRFNSVEERVFKTYVREGCESTVHAHVFEPLCTSAMPKEVAKKPELQVGSMVRSKGSRQGQHIQPPVGMKHEITYKGEMFRIEVVATETGIAYRTGGIDYPSPSAAALSITHSNVNGWRFWKLG